MAIRKEAQTIDGPARWAIGLAIAALLLLLGYVAGLGTSATLKSSADDTSLSGATVNDGTTSQTDASLAE